MALLTCPDCGGEVSSSSANGCLHCGCSMDVIWAASIPETDPSFFNFEETDDGYVIVGNHKGLPEPIKIPAQYNGKPVTEIGDNAFLCCEDIANIVILGGVTKIGKGAFVGCTRLKSIIFDSVTEIGDCAFENCTSLEKIRFLNSVTKIGEDAFEHCDKLIVSTSNPYVIQYCTDNAILVNQ